jgi:type IV pilus assembly protein PilM
MAKTTSVGLDLGATYVRAALVEYDRTDPIGSPPRICRFGQVPLDPAAMSDGEVANAPLVTDAVRHLFRANKLPTKNVVLGLGGTHVTVRELELPKAPLPQLRATLKYAVQDQLSIRVEDSILDFYPTRVADQQVAGLLVAAVAEQVSRAVGTVMAAGVIPARVDLASFALARGLARGPYATGVIGLVSMGATATDVVVLSDGVPQMVRTLPYGGSLITETVMRATGLPEDQAERLKIGLGLAPPPEGDQLALEAGPHIARRTQALVEAIGQTFSYHLQRTGQQVAGVLITGRAALLSGLDRYLSGALRLPMARAAIDQLASCTGRIADAMDDGLRSDLAVAAGLAFGGAA